MTDLIDTWQTPFLQGLMAPVFDERDDSNLTVVGELPNALTGMFVRNGPNPQFAPIGAYHPFDGDAMLHAVYLDKGTARYRNRWIESRGLNVEREQLAQLPTQRAAFRSTLSCQKPWNWCGRW